MLCWQALSMKCRRACLHLLALMIVRRREARLHLLAPMERAVSLMRMCQHQHALLIIVCTWSVEGVHDS